jgi:uncharacterized membrane protein
MAFQHHPLCFSLDAQPAATRNWEYGLRQRIRSWWFDMQQGLWFFPSLMTCAAVVLAFAMLALDRGAFAQRQIQSRWFFEGGAEGARGVLTTIAGTMITVATTVFSITIVTLQLGASQLSPRILRGFTADRGNQLVLGTFIATFAYTLLVLRTVQSESADRQVFVPAASVSLAMLLALTAIGSLIYFFHHATRTIQASVVIERTVEDTFGLIEARLAQDTEPDKTVVSEVVPGDDQVNVSAGRSGYVTSIDIEALLDVATTFGLVISVSSSIGSHVLSTTSLAAFPSASLHHLSGEDRESLERMIRQAFEVEIERTLEHDLRLGFRQISDMAVKALSPGINDSAIATTCVDRLGEVLSRARHLRCESRFWPTTDGQGGVHATSIGLQDIVDECLPQIRHYGAGDVVVMLHLLGVLREIARDAGAGSGGLIAAQVRLIVEEATATLILPADRQAIHEAARWAEQGEAPVS